jgi:hypothetical protein
MMRLVFMVIGMMVTLAVAAWTLDAALSALWAMLWK